MTKQTQVQSTEEAPARSALKLALEALTHGCPPDCKDGMTDSGGVHPWGEPALIPCPNCEAITAIREALAQSRSDEEQPAQQEPWEHLKAYGYAPGGYMMTCRGCNTTVIGVDKRASRCKPCAIKAFKAQQQEPVANDWSVFNTGAEVWSGLSLADAVAELTPERMERGWSAVCVINKDNPPLYTSPAQRKPLTDEQLLHFVDIHVGAPSMAYPLDNSDWITFARAIEAAHGIKGDA